MFTVHMSWQSLMEFVNGKAVKNWKGKNGLWLHTYRSVFFSGGYSVTFFVPYEAQATDHFPPLLLIQGCLVLSFVGFEFVIDACLCNLTFFFQAGVLVHIKLGFYPLTPPTMAGPTRSLRHKATILLQGLDFCGYTVFNP